MHALCANPDTDTALLAYEYVITFDREVRLVWGGGVTGANTLFVLNRYWLFFQYVTQVVTTYPISQTVSTVLLIRTRIYAEVS